MPCNAVGANQPRPPEGNRKGRSRSLGRGTSYNDLPPGIFVEHLLRKGQKNIQRRFRLDLETDLEEVFKIPEAKGVSSEEGFTIGKPKETGVASFERAEDYYSQANTKAASGRYQEAVEDYDHAIELNSERVAFYYSRANAKAALGRHQEAIEDRDQGDALFYYNRGKKGTALKKREDKEGAIRNYTRSIELDPGRADSYYYRGRTKFDLARYEEAIEDYTRAIELDSERAAFYYSRANAKAALERHQEAVEDYTRSIELNPGRADSYYYRGRTKFDLARYEEAIEDYDYAIKLNPNIINFPGHSNYRKKAQGKLDKINKLARKLYQLPRTHRKNIKNEDLQLALKIGPEHFYRMQESKVQELENMRKNNKNKKIKPYPFDSWFEVDVFLEIHKKGYIVIPQFPVHTPDGKYNHRFIDLVIKGSNGKSLAVECDGLHHNKPENQNDDSIRQTELEEQGWKLQRINWSGFYLSSQWKRRELDIIALLERELLEDMQWDITSSRQNTWDDLFPFSRSFPKYMWRKKKPDIITLLERELLEDMQWDIISSRQNTWDDLFHFSRSFPKYIWTTKKINPHSQDMDKLWQKLEEMRIEPVRYW